jgi:hypothetical protein
LGVVTSGGLSWLTEMGRERATPGLWCAPAPPRRLAMNAETASGEGTSLVAPAEGGLFSSCVVG